MIEYNIQNINYFTFNNYLLTYIHDVPIIKIIEKKNTVIIIKV